MARTKQTARSSTSGKAPKKQLAERFPLQGQSEVATPSTNTKRLGIVKKKAVKQPSLKKKRSSNGESVLAKAMSLKEKKLIPSLSKAPTLQASKLSMTKSGSQKQFSLTKKASSESLRKAMSFNKKSNSLKKSASLTKKISAENGQKRKISDPLNPAVKKQKTTEYNFTGEEEEIEKDIDDEDKHDDHDSADDANPKEQNSDDGEEDADKRSVKKNPATPKKKPGRKKGSTEDSPNVKTAHYLKGEFIAVRNETDGFYMCKTCQNVYEGTKKFKVYWMTDIADRPNMYKFEYVEFIHGDYRCVITHCRMKKVDKQTFELPADELDRIEKILKRGIDRQKGIEVEDSTSSDEDEEEVSTEKKEDKTPQKQTPKKEKSAKDKTPRGRPPKIPKEKVVSTKAKKTPEKGKASKPKMVKMTSEQKRNPNLLLKARSSVSLVKKDPLLEMNEVMPCVSTISYSKMVLRAVNLGDEKLLQELISDKKQVCKLNILHSIGVQRDAVHLAIKKKEYDLAASLLRELNNSKPQERAKMTTSLIQSSSSGSYNMRSLGVAQIRALSMSRGSREGNNALLKDLADWNLSIDVRRYVKFAMLQGAPLEKLRMLLVAGGSEPNNSVLQDNIWLVVRMGHRKLAAELIAEQSKNDWFQAQFNKLHIQVLQNDEEDLKPFRAVSVRKKPYDNFQITPIHCAAINPNSKYLSKLLSSVPEYGIVDGKMRKPIHYAAACDGTGPLEFLVKRGIDMNDLDGQGLTPLHIACECGRVDNAHFMLKKAEKDAEEAKAVMSTEEEEEIKQEINKYGIGGINRPCTKPQNRKWYSHCPIHIAIEVGNKDLVEVLIKHGADVRKELGPSRDKKTPLMVAAYSGQLEICQLLVKHGALVETKDKLKKTALIHAVMSGHTHVASYLIGLGTNTNQADSSGNTPVHYAAAYGWYFTLKLLLDSKADSNILNDWKVTPLGIAFLKGHIGLANILLQQPGVDINFRNENGMTMLAIACGSPLVAGIVDQVRYLVEEKGADCTINNVNGESPLHMLASNSVHIGKTSEALERCKEIAIILIANGCDPNHESETHATPLMHAVEKANVPLVKLLIEKGSLVSTQLNKENQNILHIMAEQCMNIELSDMIRLFQKCTADGDLKKMAVQVDTEGFTPLLRACYRYKEWNGYVRVDKDNEDNTSEDEKDEEEEEEEEEEKEEEDENDEEPMSDSPEEDTQEEDSITMQDEDPKTPESTMDHSDNEDNKKRGSFSGSGSSEDETDDNKKRRSFSRSGSSEYETDEDVEKISLALNGGPSTGGNITPSKQKTKEEIIRMKKWQECLNFLKALIDVCGSDINEVVQKKTYSVKQKVPEKEIDQYMSGLGKWSPLFMMLDVRGEKTYNKDDPYLGLNAILRFNPKVNERDAFGRTPLLHAAKSLDLKTCEKLLDHGADINIESDNKEDDGNVTPLLFAIKRNLKELCTLLLTRGASVEVKDSRTEDTVMHYAARLRGEVATDIISLLLKHGADINATNSKLRTPLHLSVNENPGKTDSSSEVEAFLIDNGSDLFARDCRERLPLHYVFVKIGQFADTSATDPIELCTTITSAIEGNGIDAVDEFGQTPLHRAALRGAAVCCMHLVQRGADINRTDDNGNTPIGMAVFEKHESCSIMLLQRGADLSVDVNVPTDSDDSELEPGEKSEWKWRPYKENKVDADVYPLFQCVLYNGWQGLTFMFLDELDKFKIHYNKTIECAFTVNKFNLAMSLIRKQKKVAVLCEYNDEGRNLFHLLALKSGRSKSTNLQQRICVMLKERGVDMTAKDRYGCSPLMYAAFQDNATVGSFLLDNCKGLFFDLEAKDCNGRTAFAACFWNLRHNSIFYQRLLKEGASPNILCDYPSINARMFGSFPAVDFIGRLGHYIRVSPLILAIMKRDYATVYALIKHGASLNFADGNKITPIMHAIKVNDKHIVKLLLNNSYDKVEAEKLTLEAKNKKVALLKKKSSRRLFTLGQLILTEKKDEVNANKGETKGEENKETNKASLVNGLESDDIDLEQYGTFQKTSDVDLKLRDSRQGWSVIHHLVCPLEYGTYDNVELLKILFDAGAPVKNTDNAGLTPLDYSLIRGAPNLSKALQKLQEIEKENWERPTYCGPKVTDQVRWETPEPDFRKDADIVIHKFEQQLEEETKEPWKPDVDINLELEKGAGVVTIDEEQDVPYDVLLFKIDVKQGTYGLYNFYKMQIVYQTGKDLYILLNRWGRIGDNGQFQRTPFPKKEDAVKEFCKVFRAKTGNQWKNVKSFEKKAQKYKLVEAEERQKGKKLKDIPIDLSSNVESLLPSYTQDMLKEWTDVSAMTSTLYKYHIDATMMPFGRIKKAALLKAKDILARIKPLVESIEGYRNSVAGSTDIDKYMENLSSVCELTNEYLHIVPQDGFEYEKVKPIDNGQALKEHWNRINALLDLEYANKVLVGASYRKNEINPLDYVYRCLGCKIQLMDETDVESQYLLKYISNTASKGYKKPKIEALFRISREGEEKRLQDCELDNHKLLFHGSSTYNLISILSQGLLIAPPEAPTTGWAFGKGIYTADEFSKSLNYCHNYGDQSPTKFMLVCQVALGKPNEAFEPTFIETAPLNTNSTVALGQSIPDPACDITLPSGATIPLGNIIGRPRPTPDPVTGRNRSYCVSNNEYIVYNSSQVCLRYIIQFKQ